ncbi:MAG TPA: cytochrome c oxidase assembly protein [Marinobacter sp.]|nr:cytochrome c oxidase assembly protein [Marinobacter sp.]
MSLVLKPGAGLALTAVALWLPVPVLAHSPGADPVSDMLATLLGLSVFFTLWGAYLRGGKRVRRRGNPWLFHGALAVAAATIWGPLDHWAVTSASAHMVQHMLFLNLLAPMLVVSRPLPQIMAGLGWRAAGVSRVLQRGANRPMTVSYWHGLVIWFWHMPFFYALAIRNPWVHLLEHAFFIVAAIVFWWSIFHGAARNLGLTLCSLLLTLMHTGILGAVLTFSGYPLYGHHYTLEDQQLAGLIMWVIGAAPYFLAAVWVTWSGYQRLRTQVPDEAG